MQKGKAGNMACAFCDHTMARIGTSCCDEPIFACARCGTLKYEVTTQTLAGTRRSEEWVFPMWLSRPPLDKAAARDVVRREPYITDAITAAHRKANPQ